MKSRVLIIGANGQLGKTLRDISDDFSETIDFEFVEKSKLDITNAKDIGLFFDAYHFDYCINCAAYTNVDLAETETEKAISVNGYAVKNLAINCKKHGVILIHISTDYVFDGTNKAPYLENDKTNPINVYGQSKLMGEEYIREHMTNYFIIRTSWLYSKYNKNFVTTIFNKLKANETLNIITSQRGTPTSCNDLSRFICFLIADKIQDFGTYHFSAEGDTTWYDLAVHIANHFKNSSNVTPIKTYKSKAKRPLYSVLSNHKAQQLTNMPMPKWQDSVDEVLKSLAY